jgi:hypothetical protein
MKEVADCKGQFGSFIHSIDFRLAGALTDGPFFMGTPPAHRSSHFEDNMSEKGLKPPLW